MIEMKCVQKQSYLQYWTASLVQGFNFWRQCCTHRDILGFTPRSIITFSPTFRGWVFLVSVFGECFLVFTVTVPFRLRCFGQMQCLRIHGECFWWVFPRLHCNGSVQVTMFRTNAVPPYSWRVFLMSVFGECFWWVFCESSETFELTH